MFIKNFSRWTPYFHWSCTYEEYCSNNTGNFLSSSKFSLSLSHNEKLFFVRQEVLWDDPPTPEREATCALFYSISSTQVCPFILRIVWQYQGSKISFALFVWYLLHNLNVKIVGYKDLFWFSYYLGCTILSCLPQTDFWAFELGKGILFILYISQGSVRILLLTFILLLHFVSFCLCTCLYLFWFDIGNSIKEYRNVTLLDFFIICHGFCF